MGLHPPSVTPPSLAKVAESRIKKFGAHGQLSDTVAYVASPGMTGDQWRPVPGLGRSMKHNENLWDSRMMGKKYFWSHLEAHAQAQANEVCVSKEVEDPSGHCDVFLLLSVVVVAAIFELQTAQTGIQLN